MKNNFVQLILGIWFISGIVCFAINDTVPIECAFLITIIIGIGYSIYKIN